MTISTFAISALQEIRKIKGWENAVIAGGFVRDYLLGMDFKDVDIFVPCSDSWEFRKVFGEVKTKSPFKLKLSSSLTSTDTFTKFFGLSKIETPEPKEEPKLKIQGFSDFSFGEKGAKKYSSRDVSPHFIDMVNCKFMGNIDVDIMAINLPNDENFGQGVIDNFNFNLDKVYFNGVESVTSREHQRDVDRGKATLCRLDSMEYLPRAMDKFKRLQDKYKHLIFDCSCLEIKGKEKKTVKKPLKNIMQAWNDLGAEGNGGARVNQFLQPALDAVGANAVRGLDMLDRNEIP